MHEMTSRMKDALKAGAVSTGLMAMVMALVVQAPAAVVLAVAVAVGALGFLSAYYVKPRLTLH